MASEPVDRLAAELDTLLSKIDAAMPARFAEPSRRTSRHEKPRPPAGHVRGLVAAAFRWFRRAPRL